MNCPQCTTPMVKARATSFGEEYDYCRSCKKELVEIRAAMTPTEWRNAVPHTPGTIQVLTGYHSAFVGGGGVGSGAQTAPPIPPPTTAPSWGVDIQHLRVGMTVMHAHGRQNHYLVVAVDYQTGMANVLTPDGRTISVDPQFLRIV